ncbi:MAG: flagellar hook assembly protein FlgD [Gammaproteobacteria bacterium]|nr:flagellar hook assembly protein FlgD [Gammaproteobacteria bacterium]MDH5652963.1 flagellar hook assembly protein FlgD [Gammaproteobacteria bacterium]
MNTIDKSLNPAANQPGGVKSSEATYEELGLARPKEGLKEKNLGQDEFLSLMVAQMSNQDPMKPMENGEFISQMAQFSAAKGMKEIKDSFTSLAEALQSSQALQASSMVGRTVLVPGNTAVLPEGGELKGKVDLKTGAPELVVSVLDDAGQVLKKINLGRQAPGMVNFSWNGEIDRGVNDPDAAKQQATAGKYRIRAEVIVDGKPEPVGTMVLDKVESVSLGKGVKSVTLNLGNSGSTTLSNVKEVM